MRAIAFAAIVAVLLGGASGAWAIDGASIPTDFAGAPVVVTQTNCSAYGDSLGFGVGGNEADQLFVDDDGTNLLLGITGNLEYNGNAYLIFLDTESVQGQSVLFTNGAGGPPYAVDGLDGSTMDPPFAPDYAVAVDVFGGDVYANYYVLDNATMAVRTYLGSVGGGTGTGVGSGTGVLAGGTNPDAIEIAHDDSNTVGVKGCPDMTGDPTTATTGTEAIIPLAAIGSPRPGSRIKVWVLLNSNSGDGYFSNQSLPPFVPDPGASSPYDVNGDGTIDNQPGFDFSSATYGGTQWVAHNLSGGACGAQICGDNDCDGDVDSFDISAFVLNLTDPDGFCNKFPGCNRGCAGDGDGDADIDAFDIANFVAALTGGGCPGVAMPIACP